MRPGALVTALLLTAFLAGCAEESPSDEPAPAAPATQYVDDVVQVAAPTMPRDPPVPGERTLAQAPQWRMGEWWRYRMTDGFTGGTYEFTRVVAGEDRNAGNYLVGFPIEEFSNDVMLYHIPGYGDIAQHDLSYETHDAVFKMLDFPLEDGKQWQAEFEGTGMGDATVVTEGNTALIELITPNYNVIATYDAELGEISAMTINDGGYAQYEIIDHGYDYRGLVRVPHAHDLLFIHGRLAGVANAGQSPGVQAPIGGPSVSLDPRETVEMPPGYDRASFIVVVGGGAAFGLPPPAGYFQETVTAPDGTVYEQTLTPADIANGVELKVVAYNHDYPEGTWHMQHVAAGAGIAFVEGIGYHSIDIELPSGCVVASFNAGHHNSDCSVNLADTGQGTTASGNTTATARAR